ncbi:MAG: hypothetical protein ACRDD1_22020 [Planctomycetia bacterium]
MTNKILETDSNENQDAKSSAARARSSVDFHVDEPAVDEPAVDEPAADEKPASIRYEFGEEIARGGMGVVLRGWDRNLQRELAFKIVHEKYRNDAGILRRFFDEAHILGQLQHPGVYLTRR